MNSRSAGLVFVAAATALLVVVVASLAGLPSPAEESEQEAAAVEFDGEEPLELAAPGAVVSGTADVARDTELQVAVVAENGGEQFSAATLARVDEGGNFTAEFDLVDVSPGTPVTVSVSVNGGDPLGRADGFVVREGTSVGPGEAAVAFAGDPVELPAGTATVSGTAYVDAGTDLAVVARSKPGSETHFLLTDETTVGADGEFAVTYNLTDAAPGTGAVIEVRVVTDGALLGEAEAVVVEPDGSGSEPENRSDGSDTGNGGEAENGTADNESPIEFDGEEPIRLDPANAVVSGAADLEPGTDLTVQLATVPGSETPFFAPEETFVGRDGRFEVEFDLSDTDPEPGTEAELSVLTADGGEVLATVDVIIAEAGEEGDDST